MVRKSLGLVLVLLAMILSGCVSATIGDTAPKCHTVTTDKGIVNICN